MTRRTQRAFRNVYEGNIVRFPQRFGFSSLWSELARFLWALQICATNGPGSGCAAVMKQECGQIRYFALF
jgi:hypothetical protein